MVGARTLSPEDHMGRPKSGQKKPDPEPDARRIIVHLKGSDAFAAWFDAVHRDTLIPKTSIVRQALKEWAEKRGRSAPPEI